MRSTLCRFTPVAVLALLGTAGLAACSSGDSAAGGGGGDAGDTVSVSTEVYPFTWLVTEIGGDRVEANQLMPANAEVHSFELTPRQVEQLGQADLAVVTAAVSPAVDAAIEQSPPGAVVDVADIISLRYADAHEHDEEAEEDDGHDHEEFDTHTWLALPELPKVATAIGEALAEIDPDGADTYQENAAAVSERLTELDTAYRDGLATCESRVFLITHPSFGYVADAYDLEQIGVTGLNEDTEPSPARVAEVSKLAEAEGASVVFFPGTSNPKIADVLAAELGLEVNHLDELTAAEPGTDLITLAEENLTTLRGALGCS